MKTNNNKPNCYGRKLGNEACFHTCPVRNQCYGIDKKSSSILITDPREITEYNYHTLIKT